MSSKKKSDRQGFSNTDLDPFGHSDIRKEVEYVCNYLD